MKKAVVTGGAGFIGSNVVDLLVDKGYDVTVVDNLSTGKEENINPKAQFELVDLADKIKWDKLAEQLLTKDVTVFHLAAWPRVEPSIHDPVAYNDANVNVTLNVFDACRRHGVKNIVYSSSSSVYGDAKRVPTDESEPINPMSPYALQKLIGDQYAELYCMLYKMNITCLRYFNVYGNREPTEGAYVPVIGIWFRQLKEGKALTITGDGKQTRDFVNVLDVAKANVMSAEAGLKGYNVFNVGFGLNYELNYLARLISDDVTYIAPRIEPKVTCADIAAIKKAVGWNPEIILEEYIANSKVKKRVYKEPPTRRNRVKKI